MLGRLTAVVLLAVSLLLRGAPALALSLYSASYVVPQVPLQAPAGTTITVAVTITNTGSATWNAGGANPVRLSYHWYDAVSAKPTLWDGPRILLAADVAPGGSVTLQAPIAVPATPGAYFFRFALVKEGVQWFDEEEKPHVVNAVAAYTANFALVSLPSLVAGGRYTVPVQVTNAGAALWNAGGSNPINIAYHWFDAAGKAVVWDGTRTSIDTDLPAGASRTINAIVSAPTAGGTYTLAFDMVREGIGWFQQPFRVGTSVASSTYGASYAVSASSFAYVGETQKLPVTLVNTGNVAWNVGAPNPVNLAYHWYDGAGRAVMWDGDRTALTADVAPGASQTVQLAVRMPSAPGTYTLRVDLVKEGVAWFSALGVAPSNGPFQISSGFGAGYGADTTPFSITPNAGFPVTITIQNIGQRAWSAAGTNPVRLSYHIFNSAGGAAIWDGARGLLPKDVAPGESVDVSIVPVSPSSPGSYTLKYDLVQEGVAWFSSFGVTMKAKPLDVFPGVTFYGKGWGHGVGLSQWGAQGWATGVAGPPLTGEQIVGKYFPGVQITQYTGGQPIRVLLSSPSTGCNGRTIYGAAHLRSDAGLSIVKYNDRSQVLGTAPGSATITVWLSGSGLTVTDPLGRVRASGNEPLVAIPGDPTRPITVDEKLRYYHGTLVFENLSSQLRVTNQVDSDDYVRGSVPAEMLTGWHVEAYKSQAYAARTYALARQSFSRPYDVRDDTADQCYGGASVETPVTNAAVAATAGRMLTYNGVPIRAYYSSSDGGASDGNGCVWNVAKDAGGRYTCGYSEPYLTVVPDPADLLAVGPSGPNPHRAWTTTVSSSRIEYAARLAGFNIGSFISLDLSNVGPGGHVISVRVRGTYGTVEIPGETFLRSKLLLKSTLVRLSPF